MRKILWVIVGVAVLAGALWADSYRVVVQPSGDPSTLFKMTVEKVHFSSATTSVCKNAFMVVDSTFTGIWIITTGGNTGLVVQDFGSNGGRIALTNPAGAETGILETGSMLTRWGGETGVAAHIQSGNSDRLIFHAGGAATFINGSSVTVISTMTVLAQLAVATSAPNSLVKADIRGAIFADAPMCEISSTGVTNTITLTQNVFSTATFNGQVEFRVLLTTGTLDGIKVPADGWYRAWCSGVYGNPGTGTNNYKIKLATDVVGLPIDGGLNFDLTAAQDAVPVTFMEMLYCPENSVIRIYVTNITDSDDITVNAMHFNVVYVARKEAYP